MPEPATSPAGESSGLRLAGVSAGYGRTTVLRDLSLTVPQGGAVSILGPNGAGKTTCLRVVSGVIRPTAGTVHMFGQDVTLSSVHARARDGLCHVPEGRAIFPGLSVRENLILQAPRGMAKSGIDYVLEVLPALKGRLNAIAGTLSGGQQQILALASTVVRDPKFVIVDEASLGLAPLIADQVFEFMRGLHAKGTTLLIVDQFATRALEISDYAYVLRRGQIVFAGTSRELLRQDVFAKYAGTEAEFRERS